MPVVATILLLATFSAGTLHNLRAWQENSQQLRGFLAQIRNLVPNPPPHSLLVFTGLPDANRGVYLFAVGTNAAIEFNYGRADVNAVRDSELTSSLRQRTILRFQWDEQAQRLAAQP